MLNDKVMGRLLPMYLLVDLPAGRISGAGPTMMRLLGCEAGDAGLLMERFGLERPRTGETLAGVIAASRTGQRICLRHLGRPDLILHGLAVSLQDDARLLINLGFGSGLADAVQALSLTGTDFAPTEISMEFLFLQEVNRGIIQELKRSQAYLERAHATAETQATTDPLTGLCNRRGLTEAVERALKHLHPGDRRGGEFTIAQIDLDRFKQVNDTYGHAAGDLVLRHVAAVLRDEIRVGDTAARIGGDEFVLLLAGDATDAALAGLGNRVIRRIEEPVLVGDDAQCRVSASIGMASSVNYVSPDVDWLMNDSDSALYAAKRAGRGRVVIANRPGAMRGDRRHPRAEAVPLRPPGTMQ